jgi:hypothetical protein
VLEAAPCRRRRQVIQVLKPRRSPGPMGDLRGKLRLDVDV